MSLSLYKVKKECYKVKEYEKDNFITNISSDFKYYIDTLEISSNLSENEILDVYRILLRYPEYEKYLKSFKTKIERLVNDLDEKEEEFSNMTIRTIIWYVMKKEPEKYKIIANKRIKMLVEKIIENYSDLNIAEYLFFKLFLKFAYDSINKILYFYSEEENRWKHDNQEAILQSHILKETAELKGILDMLIEEKRKDLKNSSDQELEKSEEEQKNAISDEEYKTDTNSDEEQKKSVSKKSNNKKDKKKQKEFKDFLRKINAIKKDISTISFVTKICKFLTKCFFISNLKDLFDKNPALTCTSNGVIEVINKKEIIFRQGKPEDYISNSTNTPYIHYTKELNKEPFMKKLLNWLNKVFPEDELRDYFILVCSSLLYRKNREKLFFVLTGSGDNSKSAIKRLIEITFGDYVFTLPTAMFSKRDKVGPKTELYGTKYKSVCFVQENDATDIFIGGKIKELTGNDTVYTRELYSKAENQTVSFKCFLMCNQVPLFTNIDKALRRRIVIIPFLSTWTINPPTDKNERYEKRLFKMKVDFEDQIPKMAPFFLCLLFEAYKNYAERGIRPETFTSIHNYIENFWKHNDPYYIFMSQYITKGEDKSITVERLAAKFKKWFEISFNQKTKSSLSQITIRTNFEQILNIEAKDGKFVGITCTFEEEYFTDSLDYKNAMN